MKKVITKKDEYIDNSVRVNYYEQKFSHKRKKFVIDEETEELIETETIFTKDKLLFCERLIWNYNEEEIDGLIEEHRKDWEKKINS